MSYQDLQLNSTTMLHHSATATKSPEKSITSTKRQSPTAFQQPSPKRAATLDPSDQQQHHDLLGYTKLPLPHTFPLRRTTSEPIYPVNPPVQEIAELKIAAKDSPQLPPICRTVSDPSAFADRKVVAAATAPPRPPLARNPSKSPICGESAEARRMKRMKERLKEMNKWVNEFVNEVDNTADEQVDNTADEQVDNTEPENYTTDNKWIQMNREEVATEIQVQGQEQEQEQTPTRGLCLKDETEIQVQEQTPKVYLLKESENGIVEPQEQEAVWVDKNGECVILHFNCPCGKGYQILLCGNDCYYKLIDM